MIKTLLSLGLSITIFGILNSSAQVCTPDVSCLPLGSSYGVCPDSTTGLATGMVGVAYSDNLSVRIPSDGTDFGYPSATIDSVKITAVDSLAPGLTYACNPLSAVFLGGTTGCVHISGTPTVIWNHRITVKMTVYGRISGIPATIPFTNNQYKSIVTGTTGIETADITRFDVDQNVPNPFADKTEIRFSAVNAGNIDFKIYNILGTLVYSNKVKAEKGTNTIKVEANSFASGVYIYSLSNGDKTITKRMIVAGK